MLVCSHYRLKARRRLKSITRSVSSAASDSERNDDKKNSQLQTGSRRRRNSHEPVVRSSTMQTSRQRSAPDRGDPGTRRTSWQRVRPLPIPRLPPPPPPTDDSPLAALCPLSALSPPDAEVPLLSPLSLSVSAASGRGDPRRSDPPPCRTASQRRPPDGECLTDFGQRRLTTSGGSSPYYFKLDPALTARQSDRHHQRFYSHNPCFMCESEIR